MYQVSIISNQALVDAIHKGSYRAHSEASSSFASTSAMVDILDILMLVDDNVDDDEGDDDSNEIN